jgi:hypothetical protein
MLLCERGSCGAALELLRRDAGYSPAVLRARHGVVSLGIIRASISQGAFDFILIFLYHFSTVKARSREGEHC